MESLLQSITHMNELFNTRMTEFQQELQSSQATTTSTRPASDFCEFKNFVLKALKTMQTQLQTMMDANDQTEMRHRKKILLVHGVPETKKDVQEAIASVLSSQLRIPDIDITSVKYCHRLGRLKESKPRPILVKFRDLADRNLVWGAKSSLKNSGITLSEFLIKKRHEVFLAARHRFGVTKCWTYNGSIFVVGPDGSKNRVCSMVDLDAIPGPSGDLPAVTQQATIPSKTKNATATRPRKTKK